MSAIVSGIVTNGLSLIATACGAGYQQLGHVYDVKKNNIRQVKLGYGMRPGQVDPTESVVRVYTVDQKFDILLTDVFARAADTDTTIQTSILTMYDKADEIFKTFVNTKVNSSYVLLVKDPTILEPQIVEGESRFALLTMQVTVMYRNTLTL